MDVKTPTLYGNALHLNFHHYFYSGILPKLTLWSLWKNRRFYCYQRIRGFLEYKQYSYVFSEDSKKALIILISHSESKCRHFFHSQCFTVFLTISHKGWLEKCVLYIYIYLCSTRIVLSNICSKNWNGKKEVILNISCAHLQCNSKTFHKQEVSVLYNYTCWNMCNK